MSVVYLLQPQDDPHAEALLGSLRTKWPEAQLFDLEEYEAVTKDLNEKRQEIEEAGQPVVIITGMYTKTGTHIQKGQNPGVVLARAVEDFNVASLVIGYSFGFRDESKYKALTTGKHRVIPIEKTDFHVSQTHQNIIKTVERFCVRVQESNPIL